MTGKTCPMCGRHWLQLTDLVTDGGIRFAGVQMAGEGHTLYLYTHMVQGCGSTMALRTGPALTGSPR